MRWSPCHRQALPATAGRFRRGDLHHGLLGDQYVGLQPGGSPDYFKDGDEVVLVQNAIQLEELIGKYLVGGNGPEKAPPAERFARSRASGLGQSEESPPCPEC